MNTDDTRKTVQGLDTAVLLNTAARLQQEGKPDQVAAIYSVWLEARAQEPAAYAIAFNLGVVLKELGRDVEAEQAYRLATQLNPNALEAFFNLGSQLERLGRPHEAVKEWSDLLNSGKVQLPRDLEICKLSYNNLGRLLEDLKEYELAEMMLLRSLALIQNQSDVLQHFVYIRQKQCKWPAYPEVQGVRPEAMEEATGPLSLLALTDDPARQLACARRYEREKIKPPTRILTNRENYGHSRLRVGYLSSDYCMHPVSMLTVELFEQHNRERVEVYGFCWSRDDGSPLRKRVVESFDHFFQIGGMSDEEAATLIRSHEIDVLVDLHGLTLGSRPGILGYRSAPVQVSYLGFPGTSGIPGVDYILADRYIIPPEEVRHYSEKPLYLPRCFQVSDRKRVSSPKPTRAACGLPDEGFVFCSFNNNYKFTPEMFGVWGRILKRVPGSVLWLLADNRWAEENLRNAAEAEGVSRDRVIFGGRVAPNDYLARYLVADLFLDNQPFGAGTTANDALWQGLPLLTCPGRAFASRMGGSLLQTLGVTELIADSLQDYEEKAVALGNDPERAKLLREYLQSRVRNSPLFDIPARTREIEDLYFEALAEVTGQVVPV